MNELFMCKLCSKQFKSLTTLCVHIKKIHNCQPTDYYSKFINPSADNKCPFCERTRKFISLGVGYSQTCGSKGCKSKNYSNVMSSNDVIERKKQTCIAHYGVDNPSKSNIIKEKKIETCLEHYGVDNPLKTSKVIEKAKQTCLERYGVDIPLKSKEIQDKLKLTNVLRYGVENVFQVDCVKEKIKQTNIERYGVEHISKSSTIKDNKKSKSLAKYGVEYSVQAKEVKDKIKQTKLEKYDDENYNNRDGAKRTCLEKYGVEYYFQTDEFNSKKRHKIEYKGLRFDSNDELKLYKFCEENSIQVKYSPCRIEYVDSLGNKHYYIPDFLIGGRLYEIKGDHLWKDGHLYFPYRNTLTEGELVVIDAFYAGKDACMKKNDVTVILSSQLDSFIEDFKKEWCKHHSK